MPAYASIVSSFAWTRGAVTAGGWFEWLERLPLEIRHTCPDSVRVLAVHASPGTDDGEGIHPGSSDARIRSLTDGAGADLVLVGHTHEAMARRAGGVTAVNLGSVSNRKAPDLRASYVLLECTDAGTHLTHRRVPYDGSAFAGAVRRSRHPAADFILSFQRGQQPGRTPHPDHTPNRPGERARVRADGG
jgi:diadenosine tetraphosphatase ApaH/serine/threonine PP2A family protein phosphatase